MKLQIIKTVYSYFIIGSQKPSDRKAARDVKLAKDKEAKKADKAARKAEKAKSAAAGAQSKVSKQQSKGAFQKVHATSR